MQESLIHSLSKTKTSAKDTNNLITVFHSMQIDWLGSRVWLGPELVLHPAYQSTLLVHPSQLRKHHCGIASHHLAVKNVQHCFVR